MPRALFRDAISHNNGGQGRHWHGSEAMLISGSKRAQPYKVVKPKRRVQQMIEVLRYDFMRLCFVGEGWGPCGDFVPGMGA